jgi:hypothetical protein
VDSRHQEQNREGGKAQSGQYMASWAGLLHIDTFTVDNTVAIESLHCGQHCNTLRGLPCYVFLSRIAAGGVAFSAKSCWV